MLAFIIQVFRGLEGIGVDPGGNAIPGQSKQIPQLNHLLKIIKN